MTYVAGAPLDYLSIDRRWSPRKRTFRPAGFGLFAVVCGVQVGVSVLGADPTASPDLDRQAVAAVKVVAVAPEVVAAVPSYNPLLDPGYSLGPAPVTMAESAPRPAEFAGPPPAAAEVVATAEPVESAEVFVPVPVPVPVDPEIIDGVPLPTPRPPELLARRDPVPFRPFGRRFAQGSRATPAPASPDNRSFFERLFGAATGSQPTGPVLAYAAPEDGAVSNPRRMSASPQPYDRWTAVYDIAAHTVYMPSGEKLEAHSGLGNRLDDPRYVGERMRGPTPPHVYELEPRAQLFHGVQALRLNPVGGGGVFGRTGLLAHSFMLGPNGNSNGCVSFRNYDAFLRAYRNGEIRHLVVVASQI